MFMKHYAPNRCSYIKVAKLITVLGSVDVTPTKLQSQNIQKALQVFYKRNNKNTKKKKKEMCGGGGMMSTNNHLKPKEQ